MLKFTLLKQLYYAFDPDDIPEVRERRFSDIFHRSLNVEHLHLQDIHEVTVQERYLPYSQLYRIYINEEQQEADITELRVKDFIIAFFRYYHPEYLKNGISDNLADVDILECFDVDKMPGYNRRYAYKDLITLEDIRKGKEDRGRQKHGFPGLMFSEKYRDRQ